MRDVITMLLLSCGLWLTCVEPGKYIPALGTKIMNQGSSSPLNLKGLAIGDGWTAPLEQTEVVPDQAYMLNLIDWNQRERGMHVLRAVLCHCPAD